MFLTTRLTWIGFKCSTSASQDCCSSVLPCQEHFQLLTGFSLLLCGSNTTEETATDRLTASWKSIWTHRPGQTLRRRQQHFDESCVLALKEQQRRERQLCVVVFWKESLHWHQEEFSLCPIYVSGVNPNVSAGLESEWSTLKATWGNRLPHLLPMCIFFSGSSVLAFSKMNEWTKSSRKPGLPSILC